MQGMVTGMNSSTEYLVIGAGASGITAAKNLLQQGIPCHLIERGNDIGGNWYFGQPNSAVYRSLHMVSSKAFSAYTDFPMPAEYPTYVGQALALEYLRSYARHFNVYAHAEFGREVVRSQRCDDKGWEVTLDGGETRRYRGILVANGHLWKPRFPTYPGTFDGLAMHSSQYKSPEVFRGRRILVVGAGNSGCDIAVEASQNGTAAFHSTRRGYYFWPKFVFGVPLDQFYEVLLNLRIPLALRRIGGHALLRLYAQGSLPAAVLPRPTQKILSEHFTINSTLMYHLAHGDIDAKPDIKELRGKRVAFSDGTEEEIDVIVYATGYHLKHWPFLDDSYALDADGQINLFLNIFHPNFDDLFFVGLFQTSTGNWPIADYQSQLIARFLAALRDAPESAAGLQRLKAQKRPDVNGGIEWLGTDRHAIQVDHFAYRAELRKLIARLPPRPARAAAVRGIFGRRSESPEAVRSRAAE